MKNYYALILLFLISFSSYSQTKILDSNVDWSANTVMVYLSDSVVSSISLKLGTTYQSGNVLNASYTVGSTISVQDNNISIPLSGVSQGNYFVNVTIIRPDNSQQEIEFKTSE